jgi:hypothetical protein
MTKKLILILSILIVAALIYSCTDRGTNINEPTEVRTVNDVNWITGHLFPNYLALSMFASVKSSPTIKCKPYTPPGYSTGGENAALPVLYLLPPYGGTEKYFFKHGLVAIADKLIAEGVIKPMIIACIDGSSGYGGISYGDSYTGGRYAGAIGGIMHDEKNGSLIDYMDATFSTNTEASGRAIAGLGLGGYGALKIAVCNSGNFSTVSAVSAPLDFNAAGGLTTLFGNIISGINPSGVIPYSQYKTIDSADQSALGLIISMACSFTPYVDYDTLLWTTYPDTNFYANDTIRFTDTTTLVHPGGNVLCMLPFDSAGAVYDTVWNLWLDNNISSLLNTYPAALDSMNIKLFIANDQGYGFNDQTRSFGSYLNTYLAGRGISSDINEMVFDGYEGYPATTNNFVYDILPVLLKFHSDHFPDNQ